MELHNIIQYPFDFILPENIFISYRKAHEICEEFGLHFDFKDKIEKWSYDFMHSNNAFYITFNRFILRYKEFCILNNEKYEDFIDTMNQIVVNKLINGTNYRTTNNLLDIEDKLTNDMIDLFHNKQYCIRREKIQPIIFQFEKAENIVFNDKQLEAIYGTIINKIYIINGFPGTGKSTIVKCILFIFAELFSSQYLDVDTDTDTNEDEDIEYITHSKYPKHDKISILTPTGLAYVGLSTKCKIIGKPLFNEEKSGTCHSVIYTKYNKYTDKCDCMVIDEFSMIDTLMLKELIEWCRIFNCRLIIIGDENQLPSIGPGTCLNNIIQSNIFSQTRLVEIKRQNGLLMENIKLMTTQILYPESMIDDTMKIISIDEYIMSEQRENKLNAIKINELFVKEGFTNMNTKVITYFKDEKYLCNMNTLNKILQDMYNPRGKEIPYVKMEKKREVREGDIIIRIENEYNVIPFRANGEMAQVISCSGGKVKIRYQDEESQRSAPTEILVESLYEEYMLGYALTVYKIQGSQYENVVIFIEKGGNMWDKRSLYTAISRGKKRSIIITREEDFVSIQRKGSQDKVSLLFKESSEYEL